MKRVVSFLDSYDEIPDNSKYLYSRKIEVQSEETTEQKTARIISSEPENLTKLSSVIYVHYYEVNDMDFEDLMANGFVKDASEKIKDFITRYKIHVK